MEQDASIKNYCKEGATASSACNIGQAYPLDS